MADNTETDEMKLSAVEEYLKEIFPDWKFYKGLHFEQGTRWFRFEKYRQSVRVEVTLHAINRCSSKEIIRRLEREKLPDTKEEQLAIRVYTDQIAEIPWDPSVPKKD